MILVTVDFPTKARAFSSFFSFFSEEGRRKLLTRLRDNFSDEMNIKEANFGIGNLPNKEYLPTSPGSEKQISRESTRLPFLEKQTLAVRCVVKKDRK